MQESTEAIHPLVRFAVDRRVTMGMIVLGFMVLGWLSLERLPLEYLPSFSSSNITVSAPYRSSSPQEVERLIVRPLEESLGTINGIETLSASADAERAQVRISFVEGTDMDLAAVDVRDRIDRVRHLLPDDLDQVNVRRFQSTDIPVVRFDLSAQWPVERLYDFAENVVQRRLERLEGVAQVSVGGLRTPEMQVNLDLGRLRAHGVDVREVVRELRDNNLDLSAGDVREGRRKLLVRAVGRLGSADEIRRLPLGGRGLRLGDVAEVAYAFPEKEEFNFLNGVEALTVSVNKTSSANVLAVADRVQAELAELTATPAAEGLEYRIFQDASRDVRKGLGQLRNAGLLGGLLAVAAMYLFLRRFRTTLLVAVAIPISIVATFVLIYFLRQAGVLDLTLNVVSLAGLMLALGMLVDNSIVVIESIFRHRNELGKDSRSAALAGASEVAMPILASTATTLCVFLPVIFLGGGGFFRFYLEDIGITICIVMVASLVVALTVVPLVAVPFLKDQESRPSQWIDGPAGLYGRVLRFTLRHRFLFVVTIVVLLVWVVGLFKGIERSFGSRSLERQVVIKVDTPRQYSPEQTAALYREVYQILDGRRDELDIADVAYSFDRDTGRSRGSFRRNRQFDVYLKDESVGKLSTVEARERIRAMLPTKAGVELRIMMSEGRGGDGGLELELSGDDPAVLELIAGRVTAALQAVPSIRDVDSSLESGDQEIWVRVQPERVQQAGLSSSSVASTVANALSGRSVSRFQTGDREVDLVVRFRQEDRETLDNLKQVPVFASGTALPLEAMADFDFVSGPRSIERENHLAKVSVSANTADPRASFAAMSAVTRLMQQMPLPPGYEWSYGRWTRRLQEDQQSGLFALLFALPLVYMLMAALFESFAQPFTIMFSIPFALLGVGVAMKLANQPWETMTMIGLLVLVGVVVNNAIVLIDHVNRLRRQGLSRDEAIVLGGQHRLRPILITAVTTIVGLVPMIAPFLWPEVFGAVEGRAASWAPIGLVIIGGLTTSTFLTLMIIPTLYSLIDDLTRFARRVAKEA